LSRLLGVFVPAGFDVLVQLIGADITSAILPKKGSTCLIHRR